MSMVRWCLVALVGVGAWAAPHLVLYSGGFTWVSETRAVQLAGEGELVLELPRGTAPDSLLLEGLEVTALRFQSRSVPTLELLIGRPVQVWVGGERIDGTLLAVEGGLVVATRDRLTFISQWDRVVGALPPEAYGRPALQAWVRYRTDTPGTREIVLRYLVQGLGWTATYAAQLQGTTLALTGWAAVENTTGWEFPGAKVTLIAGQVYAPKEPPEAARALELAAAPAPTPAFEYYRYVLPQPVDVVEGRLMMPLVRAELELTRRYRFSGGPVEVYVQFKNTVQPLPGGEVRFLDEGGTLFVGAATLGPTPVGAQVELAVGTAFDLRGERIQLARDKLGDNRYRDTWRVVLTSAKDEEAEVEVVETLYGTWQIVEASHPYEVLSAQQVLFRVRVPPRGEAAVRYVVEWTF